MAGLGLTLVPSPVDAQGAPGLTVTVTLNSFDRGGALCGFTTGIDVTVDNATGAPITVNAVRYALGAGGALRQIGSLVGSSGGLEAGVTISEGRTTFSGILLSGNLGVIGDCQPPTAITVVLETSVGTVVGEVAFADQTVPVVPIGAAALGLLLMPAVLWPLRRVRR